MNRSKYSKKCKKTLEFERLKAEKGCIKKTQACTVDSRDLVLAGVSVNELLLGQVNTGIDADLDCVTNDPNSILGVNTPKFNPEDGISRTVFDAMLETARDAFFNPTDGLETRLTEGRARLGLPGPSKIRLVGSITFAPWTRTFPNDPSRSDFINYNTNMGWNLLCANVEQYINQNQANPGIVSVYSQYGYIDQNTGVCKCEILEVGNKQFDPTIDYDPQDSSLSWGEQFTGVKTIDTEIVDLMIENMPDPTATGGVQLLFVAEEQMKVMRLAACDPDSENRVNTAVSECRDNCNVSVTQSNQVSTSVGRRVARAGVI